MRTERQFFQRPRLWGLLCGLTLAVAQVFTPAGMGTALAATIIISDQASCEAQGFDWISGQCRQYGSNLTVVAGDTFTNNVSFITGAFTNNGTINMNAEFITIFASVNNGTINLAGPLLNYGAPGEQLINNGTINLTTCAASIDPGFTFTGNPPVRNLDCTRPNVTINQAAGQADPATSQPVLFRADFTEAVTGFTASDVTLSGTINRTNATVTISGGPANYTVSVNGLIGNGTLLATIAANVATDNGGNGNNASTSSDNTVTVNLDTAPPTANPTQSPAPAPSGWNNTNVTVTWNWSDNAGGTGIDPANCTTSSVSSGEGTLTLNAICKDVAGNQGNASYTVQIDKTAPVVTVTGVSDGANYTLGSVPTAACSTSDALSGVATQATISLSGGNPDGSGSFTATCSGATDNAGNSAVPVSVSYTVSAPVDVCTTTALRDNFNRANGSLGSNWAGLTGQSFYKIAGSQVDVQLGGPVVWKPTTFGVNQAAFVTLSTLDGASPSQGVLLKVQSGTIPNAGAISVVYDSRAKAVRVSTLRLNTPAWTTYGNTPATFANGDTLLGCVQADGTVRVYQNNSLLSTVTLNAADQSFFNAKGGKIGLWTVAAFNAFVDDFGGGALTGVTSAALDASAVPDEAADDGAEITVAEDFPTDDTAVAAPDTSTLVNRLFLPLVNR
ncbi:MAG: hypothetical protein R3E79_46800 [Caldilineaceae bacterium]